MKFKMAFIVCFGIGLGVAFHNGKNNYSTYYGDNLDISNYSVDPPPQRTGAPGENNCTQCHGGSTFSASGVVTVDFSDPNNQYLPDSTYNISIGVANGVKNGFEMTILDGNAFQAGTFTAGSGTSVVDSGLRQYIRHNNGFTNSWNFSWTAPSSDVGNLTVYYSFNKSNNGSNSSGDSIYLGQETIFISPSAEMTEYQFLDANFNAYYSKLTNEIAVSFIPNISSAARLQVSDISGKLILDSDLGSVTPNKYQREVDASLLKPSQVYIVSLFLDNYVLNRKLFIP